MLVYKRHGTGANIPVHIAPTTYNYAIKLRFLPCISGSGVSRGILFPRSLSHAV
jgi:hypothetical protein